MGVEEKLQYDPVDLAVDIYQTIIEDELMTAKDYSREANMSDKDVKDRIATVELMHDFLEFINAPADAYYIVKDVKLYNPLYELAKRFAINFPDKGPKYEQTKVTAFALLSKMVLTGGDTVREVREYVKNIVTSTVNDTYNNTVEDTIEDLRDKLESEPITSAAEYRKRLEEATPELREVTEVYNSTVNRQARGKNVDNFVSSIRETLNMLRDIKRGSGLTGNLHFNNFSRDQVEEIRDMMVKVNIISGDLIEVYEDEL